MQRGLGRGFQGADTGSAHSPLAFPHERLHQDPLPRFHLRNSISELESAFVTVNGNKTAQMLLGGSSDNLHHPVE